MKYRKMHRKVSIQALLTETVAAVIGKTAIIGASDLTFVSRARFDSFLCMT
jgi:hypothetical protein